MMDEERMTYEELRAEYLDCFYSCCFVIRGLRASVLSVKPVSFPLPRSLSRYAPAVRLRRED
ncbi:hypothetical protein ACJ8PQ_24565, partial [Serratia sp. CY74664]|uniref:hypothetical protein n=1 Tax=Serratia sp. CY74664 TaxID=3383676 RepID=UPI003F9EDE81